MDGTTPHVCFCPVHIKVYRSAVLRRTVLFCPLFAPTAHESVLSPDEHLPLILACIVQKSVRRPNLSLKVLSLNRSFTNLFVLCPLQTKTSCIVGRPPPSTAIWLVVVGCWYVMEFQNSFASYGHMFNLLRWKILSGEWPPSVDYHKIESTIRLFQNEKSYFTFHRACSLPWNPPSSWSQLSVSTPRPYIHERDLYHGS